MREIRTSGSEGGEAEPNRPSLPLSPNYRPGDPVRRYFFSERPSFRSTLATLPVSRPAAALR